MAKSKHIASLLLQYISSAFIVGIIVIIISLIAYSEIIKSSNSLTSEANTVSKLLALTSETRSHITSANKAIDVFLLEPARLANKFTAKEELNKSQLNIKTLIQSDTISNMPISADLEALLEKINLLKTFSGRLFYIRTTANEQYPALAVSSRLMRPLRNKIFTVFNASIEEFTNDQNTLITPEYILLNKARYTWLRTISEYRLYLTNRIGSFNEKSLNEQEVFIEQIAQLLIQQSLKLTRPDVIKNLGFEGQEVIKSLPVLIKKWVEAYYQVKTINHSGKWRMDTELMRTTIIPLTKEIHFTLLALESTLKDKNQSIMFALSQLGTKQSYVLGIVISLLLAYIIISIFLIKKLLFIPIEQITKEFTNTANDPSSFNQIRFKKTKETTGLINAFNLMILRVSSHQHELEYKSLHDSLTSLPNRTLIQQRIDYQILISNREKSNFSLMMLDLNRFKEINDTLGHHIGDELLVQLANRLSKLMREIDTIARLGGDEFAVLLPSTTRDSAVIVSNKITACLKKDFNIKNYKLNIDCAIGITQFPEDGDDANILMQHADIAMYTSKKNKSNYSFYHPSEDSHSIAQLSLGRDLKKAIKESQLEMYLQPKIDTKSSTLNGAEALLRWNHPIHGFINPEKILEIAENNGLTNTLTYWIIHHSIECCTAETIPKNFNLSINLEAQNLRDSDLVTETISAIKNNPSFKAHLIFEITENAMMKNPEQSIKMLNELTKLGIAISIDDFGTGFSSLAYLKQLPVSQLKIDKSFVMDMNKNESDKTIVFSTINLSHSLGLEVVAEGVENKETLEMLKEMGCDIAQGYYFSKPLPATDFQNFVAGFSSK